MKAVQFLVQALSRGERPKNELVAEAEILSISEKRLGAAAVNLHIAKRKDGMQGKSLWKLP
jgi:hypothetical protein